MTSIESHDKSTSFNVLLFSNALYSIPFKNLLILKNTISSCGCVNKTLESL